MSESTQHKLDRVRRARVQITYDVETGGALQKVELPFVVGVLADLSGKPKDKLPPMKERKFTTIDRDNFNNVLSKAAPRATFRVDNKIANDDTKIGVDLNFKHMDDFEPAKIAEQIPAMKDLLDMRQKLDQLLSKMEGNDKLEELLSQVLNDSEKAAELAKQMGITGDDAKKEESE